MSVLILDEFDRASLGSDWTALNIGINASFPGELRVNTTGTSNYAIYTAAQTTADAAIEAVFSNPQINFGLNLRCSLDRTTRYVVEPTGATTARIRKIVSGTGTVLTSGTVPAGGVGDVLRFEVEGTTLRVLINGVQYLTTTDSSITGALGTYSGITTFASASNARFASIQIENLSTSGESKSGGSTSAITVAASGAGTKYIPPASGSGGSTATVTTSASGAGTAFIPPVGKSGGSSAAVRATAITAVPGSGYTQEEMPTEEQAWTLAAEPTMTAHSTAPVTGTTYLPNDSRFVYTRPVVAGTQGSPFVRPEWLVDKAGAGTGTDPLMIPAWGLGFMLVGSQVAVRFRQRTGISGMTNINARSMIRVKVNGQWTTMEPRYLTNTETGALGYTGNPDSLLTNRDYYVLLDFGTSASRRIQIDSMLEFGGVIAPAGNTINVGQSVGLKMVTLGDSMFGAEKHGTGNFALTGGGTLSASTYTHNSDAGHYAAQRLGYTYINSSAGSTGYGVAGDTTGYKNADRMALDVLAHNPALIVVGTPNNDRGAGRTQDAIVADVTTVLTALRTGAPNALIVVLGAPNVSALGDPSSANTNLNAAMQVATQPHGAWFADPALGRLYTPTGAVVRNDGDWFTALPAGSISSDGLHPTQVGAQRLGMLLGDILKDAHPFTSGPAGVKGARLGTTAGVTVSTGGSGRKVGRNGTTASVGVTTGGTGRKATRGGSGASVVVSATGAGIKFIVVSGQGGSTASVGVTTAGSGRKATRGSATGTVNVVGAGAGRKGSAGSGTVLAVVTATGDGVAYIPVSNASGGATASVIAEALGLGQKIVASGATATIVVIAEGGPSPSDTDWHWTVNGPYLRDVWVSDPMTRNFTIGAPTT